MQRNFLTLGFLLAFALSLHSATITWVGPGGSNWNNAANWLPALVPGAADDVVFNTTALVEMDIIPALTPFIYAINSLRVTGSAAVTLALTQAGGGTRILQLRSANSSPLALNIEKGSSLTMNAVNASGTLTYILDLTASAAIQGEIAGTLNFTGSGAGTGDAYLKIYASATNYANLAVRNTGIIKYFPNSGNTLSAAGSHLVMESGSTYEINKNGGSLPYGNWDDNSNILVTGATSNGNVFFSQSRYGNLRWDSPAMSAATQMISNLSPVTTVSLNNFIVANSNARELRLKTGASAIVYDYTVRGKLDIGTAATLVISGNTVTAGGARLHVMGHLSNAGILKSEGAAGTVNELELNGNVNQDISNTGTLSGPQLKFIMNNTAGATLLTPLILPGTTSGSLQLNSGRIKTSAASILTLLDNAGYTGGSATSFIEGPMKKIGNDETFIFPVGKGFIYAPAGFYSPGMSITDAFQAEYFRLNPQSDYGNNYETPPLHHISYVEYWQIEKLSGSTAIPANITLTITAYSFAKNINSSFIAGYDAAGHQWQDRGVSLRTAGPPAPPYITGTISSAPVTSFGIFTLASDEPEAINPLPLQLLSFDAVRESPARSRISWRLASNAANVLRFEVEVSVNGSSFAGFATLNAVVDNRYYKIDHDIPKNAVIRYRLKLQYDDGSSSYSEIITLNTNTNGWEVTAINDPVTGTPCLHIQASTRVDLCLRVLDLSGRLIQEQQQRVNAGSSRLIINKQGWGRGIHLLLVTDGRKKVIIRLSMQ